MANFVSSTFIIRSFLSVLVFYFIPNTITRILFIAKVLFSLYASRKKSAKRGIKLLMLTFIIINASKFARFWTKCISFYFFKIMEASNRLSFLYLSKSSIFFYRSFWHFFNSDVWRSLKLPGDIYLIFNLDSEKRVG